MKLRARLCCTSALGSRLRVKRKAKARGLLAKPRQDGGVAPVAQDQVGIVPREQMLKRNRGRLA